MTETEVAKTQNPRDEAALQTIFDLRAKRLQTVRDRAEKWIAGLGAVVAVLATVTLVKGPEKHTDLPAGVGNWILGLSIGAGGFVVVGLVAAYSAAFGGMLTEGALDRLMKDPPGENGAAQKLGDAVESETKWARRYMRTALIATILGICLLAAAVVVSWAEVEDTTNPTFCAVIDGNSVVFSGKPDLTEGTIDLTECLD